MYKYMYNSIMTYLLVYSSETLGYKAIRFLPIIKHYLIISTDRWNYHIMAMKIAEQYMFNLQNSHVYM